MPTEVAGRKKLLFTEKGVRSFGLSFVFENELPFDKNTHKNRWKATKKKKNTHTHTHTHTPTHTHTHTHAHTHIYTHTHIHKQNKQTNKNPTTTKKP